MDLQALAMMVVGLAWGAIYLRVFGEERRLHRDGVPVEATVTGRSRRSSEGGTTHRLHTTYEAPNGTSHRRRVSVCQRDYEAVADGATVTLLMHPLQPRRSCLAPGSLPATDREAAESWLRQEGTPQRLAKGTLEVFRWIPPVALVLGGLLGLLGLIS